MIYCRLHQRLYPFITLSRDPLHISRDANPAHVKAVTYSLVKTIRKSNDAGLPNHGDLL